jgi:hypothetical protein
MGPLLYMQSVVDQNVMMQHTPVVVPDIRSEIGDWAVFAKVTGDNPVTHVNYEQ